MRAIDTNVLVRILARDDPKQTALAEAFIEKGAWVSILVLAEAAWVLKSSYSLEHKTLVTGLEMLLNHTALTVQEPETVAAALNLYREQPRLGFADCLILQLARKNGHLPLGTFDRRLAKVDGAQAL